MCNPLLIVAGVQIAGALVAAKQANKQAAQQGAAVKQQADNTQAALTRQQQQAHDASAQQINDAAKQSLHDMATFDTVAGEYGGGNTDQRAAAIHGIQNGENLSTLQTNAQNQQSDISFQGTAAHDDAMARLASIAHPSNLGVALQIAGAAAGAYTAGGFNGLGSSSPPANTGATGSDQFGYKGRGGF